MKNKRAGLEPTVGGTAVLLLSLAIANGMLGDELVAPSIVAQSVAYTVAAGILASLLFDLQRGYRNIVRTDIVSIGVLYALTLVEMLYPRAEFDARVNGAAADSALQIVLLGFAGLAIGRHAKFRSLTAFAPRVNSGHQDIPTNYLLAMVYGAMVLACFHMFLATNFNVIRIYDAMVGPRFSVPWARGRLGGWRELLNELTLLFYLIPPLTAILTIRARELSKLSMTLVWICFLVTLFKAFAGGTRNIFLTYLLSFSCAYILFSPALNLRRMAIVGALSIGIALTSCYFMLEFRASGLRNYVKNESYNDEDRRDNLSIDNNLESLSKVVTVFPSHYPHLGWEVPIWALVKPIPRALWAGKPEGLTISIEQALMGDDAYTIATTYVGEAYMAFGLEGVLLTSILFGMLASAWNQMAGNVLTGIGAALYSSGFFAAAITMRSLFWLTTAILPTVALYLFWRHVIEPRLGRERPLKNAEDPNNAENPAPSASGNGFVYPQ